MSLGLAKFRSLGFYLLISLFFIYSIANIWIHLKYPENEGLAYDIYTDSYGVIAMFGGFLGLSFYRKWGGVSSVVGRALVLLAVGLLFQFLGQVSYAYFRYIYSIEVAYPSFGEIFYFGSIPLYILGTWYISVAAGIRVRLARLVPLISSLIFTVLVTAISISISYSLFLSNYDFSNADLVVVFLEIGYPLGQAISISLTVLAFILSRRILGGRMKSKVLFILMALLFQYVADIYYTYEVYTETFYSAGLSDYLYLIAYFVMGVALFKLGQAPDSVAKLSMEK